MEPNSRNGNGFNGYCHFCNKFGHKSLNCRSYVRRTVGNPSNPIRCWTCNDIGDNVAYCRTIRCYNCSGIGHKAQNCWNSKRRSTRRSPDNPIRNINEIWTKIKTKRMNAQKKGTKGQPRRNVVERMKNQRTSTKDKENSQTWVRKTEQLHMDEVDQCKEDGRLTDCLF